uniref:Uncharacterized protein LOC111112173 isoform X4 n=1 Tax=Crassostrea virginica TaxID=6565 RepID=A0A8B8BPL9_CRAVI|nr:uncharacterized protein LOC111112173 isoform X4 [Crassostrea virginica]
MLTIDPCTFKNETMAKIRPIILLSVLIFRLLSAYENIALNKPAYQQYPYTGDKSMTGNATNAVDGLKSDRSAWGGQCVVSEKRKQSATWWVDLTEISCISHITVYYMTGNKKWGQSNEFTQEFLGFSIYISNTTEKSEGVLCFKDSVSNKNTIPDVFNITCSIHGRYVIFYNERQKGVSYPNDYSKFAYNDLCEVEVYGLDNCSILCPDRNCHCCNNRTNVCQGCKPGYQGKHCEIELDEKRDGYRKRCGYCSDLSKCNYASSTCFYGYWSDMKPDDSKQDNQLINSSERQTIAIGQLNLTFQILIFVILLLLLMLMMFFVFTSRNQKKCKQQRNKHDPTEEPTDKKKFNITVDELEMTDTDEDKDGYDSIKGTLGSLSRNQKKSKRQRYKNVPTEEPSEEKKFNITVEELEMTDDDKDKDGNDSIKGSLESISFNMPFDELVMTDSDNEKDGFLRLNICAEEFVMTDTDNEKDDIDSIKGSLGSLRK